MQKPSFLTPGNFNVQITPIRQSNKETTVVKPLYDPLYKVKNKIYLKNKCLDATYFEKS